MKNIFLILILLSTSIVFAQKVGVIEGTVQDASLGNDPMMYATVTIKETKQSVTTGFRGGYFFKDLKPGKYTLMFDFLGYESVIRKVEIKTQNLVIDTVLKPTTAVSFEDVQLTSN